MFQSLSLSLSLSLSVSLLIRLTLFVALFFSLHHKINERQVEARPTLGYLIPTPSFSITYFSNSSLSSLFFSNF